ncbi:ABC transporter substrate-binding protein [Leucobacter luti]|uniref:ABC transporter substrate-binding protein n=1 Tax=Leucobacter luti TaxID=340320 RepID=UPI003CFCB47C
MKKHRLAWLGAIAAAAIAMTGCSASASGEDAAQAAGGEPIVIGVSGPLTGNQAEYGKNWQEGIDIALDEINGAGGVNGRPIEIDFQDSQGQASQATTIAQRFVSDDKILAVLGDFSSATSMVASPLYQRGGLLQLGITNSHPDFTKTGDFIFSPSITQEEDARELADGAHTFGSKIAVINLNTDWGISARDIFTDQVKKNGDELVYQADVEEASTDFKPQLVQLREAKPDVVVFFTYYSTTSLLVQQAKQAGIPDDVIYVAVGSNYSAEFLDLAGDAAEGVYLNTSFTTESDDEKVTSFVSAFDKKYGYQPNLFAAYAYDGVKQIAWAAEHAKTVDRAGIRDALRDADAIPSIIYGEASYDENRRAKNPVFKWLEVQDGAFVPTEVTGH